MKECTKCLETKERTEFYKSKKGFASECKECKKEYVQWYRENRLDKDANKEYQREWQREYYKKNPDAVKEASSKYSKNNREKVNAMNRRWAKDNPEKIAHIKANRYAREKGAEGSHTLKEWQKLCEYWENKCACCQEEKKLTKDHIVPLLHNGTNYIDNLQPLCWSCNASKGAKTIRYEKELHTTAT